MRTIIARGGAAALFTVAVTLPAGAQVVQPVQMSRRDSTVVIRMVPPTKALIDSITTLMRVLDSEPLGSPVAAALRSRIDALLPGKNMLVITKRGELTQAPQGWIGFTPQGPHFVSTDGDNIQYFAYPSIISVDPESPAAKAGIEVGDLLIAYNGMDVRGREFNLPQLLVPDRKVSITVRRDGETKDYSVIPVKAPVRVTLRAMNFGDPPGDVHFETVIRGDDVPERGQTQVIGPRGGVARSAIMFPSKMLMLLSPNGAFGAVLSTVSPELAKTLKLEPGVLVNDVADDTPAAKAGLHPGDVIVNVSGQAVASLKAFQVLLREHISEQTVALKVVRDRKPRIVTVSW